MGKFILFHGKDGVNMDKKHFIMLGILIFFLTSFVTFTLLIKGVDTSISISERELGKMCVAGVFPAISRGVEREALTSENEGANPVTMKGTLVGTAGIDDTEINNSNPEEVPSNAQQFPMVESNQSKAPLVIIYHTSSDGNFHVIKEKDTVREVGDVLMAELEKQGIPVIHDKTLHDNPSYNQSYSRSMETIQRLMKEYPTAKYIIDLHRDAAAYGGNKAKTAMINGEVSAKYSLVVGMGNPNAAQLSQFANNIIAKSEEMYPGFGGKIIEKSYKYNEYVSDYAILLEIGNNENHINESKCTAKYFANVLTAVIKGQV